MSEKKREWTKELPPPGAYWLDFPGADNYILGLVLKDSGRFELVTCNCGYDGEQAKALGVRYSPIEPRSKQNDAGSTPPRPLGSHSRVGEQDGETLKERVIGLESRVADALYRIGLLEPTVWRLNGIEHDSAKTHDPDPNAAAEHKQEDAATLVWTTKRPTEPGPFLYRIAKRDAVLMRVFLAGKKMVLHGMRPEDPSPGIPLSDDEFWGNCEFAGPVAMPTSGDVPRAGQVLTWSPDVPEPGAYWVQSSMWNGAKAGLVQAIDDGHRCVIIECEPSQTRYSATEKGLNEFRFLFSPIVPPDGLDEGC